MAQRESALGLKGKENEKQPEVDEEIKLVQEQLIKIENILKAESKRRIEANQITEEYILNYLDSLEQNLNKRVNGQFQDLDERIKKVDTTLTRIELQFD